GIRYWSVTGVRRVLFRSTDAQHVAALLVVGIRIEEIVAAVLQQILDLAAGHLLHVGFGIGDRRLGEQVLHRQWLTRQRGDAPARSEERRVGKEGRSRVAR